MSIISSSWIIDAFARSDRLPQALSALLRSGMCSWTSLSDTDVLGSSQMCNEMLVTPPKSQICEMSRNARLLSMAQNIYRKIPQLKKSI